MDANTMFFVADRLGLDAAGHAAEYFKMGPDSISAMTSAPYTEMTPASVMWSHVQDFFDRAYGADRPGDPLQDGDEPSLASSTTTATTQASVETITSDEASGETGVPVKPDAASTELFAAIAASGKPSLPSPPVTTDANTSANAIATATSSTFPSNKPPPKPKPQKAYSRRVSSSSSSGSNSSSRSNNGNNGINGKAALISPVHSDKERAKRSQFLERNRIAASKCRRKKREWLHELEDTKIGLEHRHSELQHELGSLLGEVGELKNQLMRHASCNDPNINLWIETEARRFVAESGRGLCAGDGPEAGCGTDLDELCCCGCCFGHAHTHTHACAHAGGAVDLDPEPKPELDPGLASPSNSAGFSYDHMPDSMFDPEMA